MFEMDGLSRVLRSSRGPTRTFAITFALIVGLVGPGCLGGPTDSERPRATLRIGSSGDYSPFSRAAAAPGAEMRGFSIDLAKEYAEATGRDLAWVPFTWPTLADDLTRGRFDFALSGVTIRPDRSIAGRFSLPVTVSGAIVLVPTDSDLRHVDALAQPGLAFAVNAGGHLERTARALFPEARIVPVPDNGSVLDRLGDPGIDAVVTDSLEAPHWLERRPELRPLGPLTRDRKAAWFPIGADAERGRFDAWLLEAERDGRLAELRRRHGLPADRTAEPTAALLALLDERLSLMTEVARVKQVMGRAIEDRPREEQVLGGAAAAVAHAAAANVLPPPDEAEVRAFYRAQIEAAKSIQRAWTETHPAEAAAPETPSWRAAQARLAEDVRPALLDLGDRIATLLVVASAGGDRPPSRERVEESLSRHALPASDLDAIHASLERLFDRPR